jgi:hypothetical protein
MPERIRSRETMKRLACRLFGHRWKWPEIPVVPMIGGVQVMPPWRECDRCGLRQQDEGMESEVIIFPAFQGPVEGFGPLRPETNRKLNALGLKVKREMGWE